MKATYVSIWEGGTPIRSSCEFNPETKTVSDIESVDVDGMNLSYCEEEFVELPNGEVVKTFTREDDGVEIVDGEPQD